MDHENSQSIELDIKDILLFVLRKIHIILLIGSLIAGLGCIYGFMKSSEVTTDSDSTSDVLNIDSKLPGESDTEYDTRSQLVNRAQTIMANTETLNSQNDKLRDYISNSKLMQLDPMNVAVSEAELIIRLDESSDIGVDDAIIDSYISIVRNGDYLKDLAADFGCEIGMLQELITVTGNTSYNGYVLDDGVIPVRTLKITVWGISPDFSEAILNGALNEINNQYPTINNTIAEHTITEIANKTSISFVLGVRDSQLRTMTTYQTLQSQIDYGNKYLDDIAKQLGLTDRNSLYSDNDVTNTKPSPYKYIIAGFLLGAMIAIGFYIGVYAFGRRLVSQSQFHCLFPNCKVIGVLKPINRRRKLGVIVDKLSGDDNDLPVEKSNSLISANYNNMTRGMNRVLLTSTIENEQIKSVVEDLKITCDIKLGVFNDPEILGEVGEYDGVVIIEQRGVSEKKKISKEYELLNNGAKSIVGGIIL